MTLVSPFYQKSRGGISPINGNDPVEYVEFARDLIIERTSKGRARAKAQGNHLGRKGQNKQVLKLVTQTTRIG